MFLNVPLDIKADLILEDRILRKFIFMSFGILKIFKFYQKDHLIGDHHEK